MTIQLATKYSDITWTEVDSLWLYNGEHRFDGSFYCGNSVQSFIILDKFKGEIEQLAKFTKNIFYPGRFKRIWVDEKHGEAFFTGSQILEAYPSTDKYIAPSKISNIDSYKVSPQQILVTRSGTIGNLTLVTKKLSNQLVTEDAIRIGIQDEVKRGYVYAYLKSRVGNPLIQQSVFGAVIDHIEPNHIEQIRIPIIDKADFQKVGTDIVKAFSLRDQANDLIDESQELFYKVLNLPRISEDDVQYLNGKVKAWEVSEFGFENRLDGSFYYPLVDLAIKNLEKSGHKLSTLGDKDLIEKVFIPGRFKRVYVKEEYGIPFLSGKNIIQIRPEDLKYLARSKTKKLDTYIIKEGWTLITCSGTIGRTALVTSEWDGWTATQHILRVVPKNIEPGYLYVFLSSDYGQAQIKRFIHGSVVDEITDKQTEQVAILIPDKNIQKQIGEKAMQAFELRAKANEIEKRAIEFLEKKIKEFAN